MSESLFICQIWYLCSVYIHCPLVSVFGYGHTCRRESLRTSALLTRLLFWLVSPPATCAIITDLVYDNSIIIEFLVDEEAHYIARYMGK